MNYDITNKYDFIDLKINCIRYWRLNSINKN